MNTPNFTRFNKQPTPHAPAAGDHFTIFEKVTIIGNFSITPSQKVLIKEPPPKFN